jgi:hypothetical protein
LPRDGRSVAHIAAVAFAVAVGGCAGGAGSSTPSSGSVASPPPTTNASPNPPSASQAQPFTSAAYGYTVQSADWIGADADAPWDGTGAPGDGDPTVDVLLGPNGERFFGFGEHTGASLARVVAAFRAANAGVHPCPQKPEATHHITVGGASGVLDEMHCPVNGGVFTLLAFVKRGDRLTVFFTFDQPGREAAMRQSFRDFLGLVSPAG